MKRMKEMSKRFLLWIGAAAMLLSAGCAKQKTFAEPTMQLDMAQLVATATGESDTAARTGSLRAQVNAPDACRYDAANDKGNLIVSVDAQVTVPDADGMPMARVRPADFPQALVYRMFRTLCGDTAMYRVRAERTKADIQAQIAREQQALSQASDIGREVFQQAIRELETALETAPDTVRDERTDGTMWESKLERVFIGK